MDLGKWCKGIGMKLWNGIEKVMASKERVLLYLLDFITFLIHTLLYGDYDTHIQILIREIKSS